MTPNYDGIADELYIIVQDWPDARIAERDTPLWWALREKLPTILASLEAPPAETEPAAFTPEYFACPTHGNTLPQRDLAPAIRIGCCPLAVYHPAIITKRDR